MIRSLFTSIVFLFVIGIFTFQVKVNAQSSEESFTNSIGMKFVLIPSGKFRMGMLNPSKDPEIPKYLGGGDWDELPVHEVHISNSFYMAETEVTIEQFRQFRPGYEGIDEFSPCATGISWYDAVKFCEWLSEKEGLTYRLPTEAEWEYACRAGSETYFSWSDTLPPEDVPNPWHLKNMHSAAAEWCLDWHASYSSSRVTDPVGPSSGMAKVVRGGGLDRRSAYYSRAANRAGIAPSFGMSPIPIVDNNSSEHGDSKKIEVDGYSSRTLYHNFIREVLNNQGRHHIGFRVVQAALPETDTDESDLPFFQKCIIQNQTEIMAGPDPEVPYFRKRFLLPIPPENTPEDELKYHEIIGFHPGILRHHHSPALEVCPNGDVIAIYYTSVSEVTPDVALIASRLRFGADEWDFPSLFLDFPDVNDHAPLLWRDGSEIYLFWGANKLASGYPFQWIVSKDNGESWTETRFPVFETAVGPHSAQPINSAFRDPDSTIYVSSDGVGPESILWASHNNGKTWIDAGGRTGGRHTTFVLLRDGRILGMGGKSSDIDGFMPQSISDDGGKTWAISKTPFPSLGSNQRPTIIRLNSGRLFFAGDMQHRDGSQPAGITRKGCYVALSEDEGATWMMRILPGAQYHESEERAREMGGETLGYAVARQGPNGLIHLITSMNQQCLHFEMNEAWILSSDTLPGSEETLMVNTATTVSQLKTYREFYPDGTLKAEWTAGRGNDGRYLLHGPMNWYFPNGKPEWKVSFDCGEKTGEEVFQDRGGHKQWTRVHRKNGRDLWTTWWLNGKKKSESSWKNMKCDGKVRYWNSDGNLTGQLFYRNGKLTEK